MQQRPVRKRRKKMSLQLLFRHSKYLDSIDSTQPWELHDTYERACAALKAFPPVEAQSLKVKAKAALIYGLWEISRIEEQGRLDEANAEAVRTHAQDVRDKMPQPAEEVNLDDFD